MVRMRGMGKWATVVLMSTSFVAMNASAVTQTKVRSKSMKAITATSATNTSLTSISTDRFVDHLNVSYAGAYYGPSIASPSSYVPDAKGAGPQDLTTTQLIENVVTAGYKLNNGTILSARVQFNYKPVLGQEISLMDPALKIENGKFITAGNFNLYADFRWYLPATSATRNIGFRSGLRTTQLGTYDLPHTRWTLGWQSFVRVNVMNGGSTQGNDLEFYMAPFIQYKFSPKVSMLTVYETDARRMNTADGTFSFVGIATQLQPGVSWDITPSLNVNPFFNIPTAGHINLDTTSINMYVSAKLL